MADLNKTQKSLEEKGYTVTRCATGAQAADYLDKTIDGLTVGMGGSMTLAELDIPQRLSAHNTFISHWSGNTPQEGIATEVYLTSLNALSEDGVLVNIDGTGNRVASSLFGHKKVIFVVGSNKIAPDYEGAVHRARNVASPKNAQRLKKNTPCAEKADRCYDCKSPQRICRALVAFWEKPTGSTYEIVLVDEPLGF